MPRLLVLAALGLTVAAAEPERFRAVCAERHAALAKAQLPGVKGSDGWYFLANELQHYGAGRFWGEDAVKASQAEKNQDPLPAISEFAAQCAKAGVALIVVPVPGKVVIHPDRLDPALALPAAPGARLDEPQKHFYDLLATHGVTVIDLTPEFLALRAAGTAPYCRQDSHWSPAAVRRCAQLVAAQIKGQAWYAGAARRTATVTRVSREVRGDLAEQLKDESEPKERLELEEVRLDGEFVASDDKSPLVVMGDSHTLVFHGADLLAEHCGLPDLLAHELGIAPDITGVKGSGANGSRGALARRRDNLAGKKCLVWCFTAREFTSFMGWQKIPVVR